MLRRLNELYFVSLYLASILNHLFLYLVLRLFILPHFNRAAREHSDALQANPMFVGGGAKSEAERSVRHVEKGKVFVVNSKQSSSSTASAASSSSEASDSAATAASAAMDTDASACSLSQPSLSATAAASSASSSSSSSGGAQHKEDAAQPAYVHVAKPGTVVSISEMTFDGVSVEEMSELTAQAHVMRICESEGLPIVAVEVTRGRVKVRGGDGELRMAALVAFDCEATAKRAEVELKGRPEFRQARISPCTAHQLTTRIAYRGMSCFTHVWLCRNFLDCSLIFALFFSFRTRAAQSGLSHPSIVRVVGAYHEHERLSLVMEWVRGGDLFDAICRSGA